MTRGLFFFFFVLSEGNTGPFWEATIKKKAKKHNSSIKSHPVDVARLQTAGVKMHIWFRKQHLLIPLIYHACIFYRMTNTLFFPSTARKQSTLCKPASYWRNQPEAKAKSLVCSLLSLIQTRLTGLFRGLIIRYKSFTSSLQHRLSCAGTKHLRMSGRLWKG